MLKKFLVLLLALSLMLTLVACGGGNETSDGAKNSNEGGADGEAPFHIGIVTGTVSQSEDEQRGAEAMIEKYGDADNGGYIKHLNYPDNYMQEQETTIQQIASLADDPLMKVIVVNQGPPGTTAAFNQVREKNPDIILLVGNSQEDTSMIEAAADLIADPDNINRG